MIFGLQPAVIGLILLVGLSIGGVLYAFFYNSLEAQKQADKRLANIKSGSIGSESRRKNADKIVESTKRRKQVGEALADLDKKNKTRETKAVKPPLKILIRQAGLKMSVQQFFLISLVAGLVIGFVALIGGLPFLYAAAIGFVGAFGLPRWFVGFKRKRRMTAFLAEFPNAIEVIVRSIKSGLPLNDGLRLIATEAKEPVRTEFARIVEAQQVGLSTPEACARMYESMPIAEANFFAVVIQIQSQAGGNLAEALGNLASVLRARKTMKAKVAAMSMEAKASAYIIGSLPFAVAFLVSLSSPDYLTPLYTTDTGYIILGCSAVWMGIGIFVMKQMINFEV